MTKTHPRTRE